MSKRSDQFAEQRREAKRQSEPAQEKTTIYRDSATGVIFVSGGTSTAVHDTVIPFLPSVGSGPRRNDKVERAVMSHIKAVRTLGRKHINTAEIAEALSIPVSEVNQVLGRLEKKGVRRTK